MRDSLGSVVQGVGLVKEPRPEAVGIGSGDFASPRVVARWMEVWSCRDA